MRATGGPAGPSQGGEMSPRGELLPGVELVASSPLAQNSHIPTPRDYNRQGHPHGMVQGPGDVPGPASTPVAAGGSHAPHVPVMGSGVAPPPGSAFHRKSIGDWEFVKTIGSGSMGKVKLAKHRVTNEICAVKVVTRAAKVWQRQHQNDPPSSDPAEISARKKEFDKEVGRDRRTIREAALGKILYHPFICRLYEMYPMSNHYYMLFEYVQGGQMLDYIVSHGSLKEAQARKFCRGIASALDYCHSNNIVHRDLKIENIMINTQGEIKIIDFGLSNLFDRENLLKTYCGSLYFAAPELLSAHPYVGPEVDIWSFGVVLYVLVCGKVPFDDKSVNNLHEKIKRGNVEYPSSLSGECVSLLQRMLVVNPSHRGNIREVINHPWLNKGYQGPVKSYLPPRRPLEYPLDQDVVKSIVELDLAPSVNHVNVELDKILRSQAYVSCVDNWYAKSKRQMYDPKMPDPTRGVHPILSMYYLVDEMMQRRRMKLEGEQAVVPQMQQQVFNAASERPGVAHESQHRVVTQPVPAQYQHRDPFGDSGEPVAESMPAVSVSPRTPKLPLAPFLKPPQAAHTSPHGYDRPSPIIETDMGGSPPPPAQQSPVEETFGSSILRKLSIKKDDVRRVGSVKVTTKEKQGTVALPVGPIPRRKTHQRAASAYTASAFVSDKLPPVPVLIAPTTTGTSGPNAPNGPTGNTATTATSGSAGPTGTIATLPPDRKYHPGARAKSLGHARKFSLQGSGDVPPLPMVQLRGSDNGFFDEEDNSSVQFSVGREAPPKLTDQEIIDQFEHAAQGTMPSIEYPKTLFLKGFFSVQTTSTKPLPLIRYGIITVLPQLGVEFVEVKGGFICVHYPSIVESPAKSGSPSLMSPGRTLDELVEGETDEDRGSQGSQATPSTPAEMPSLLSTPQKGHRRKFSLGNSISQQGTSRNKLTVATAGYAGTGAGGHTDTIPTTPAPANVRAPNEDSSESLAYDETTGASDMLVSSRVEQKKLAAPAAKKPLKFEIHIVKVPLVGLYGIQFKKVGGNTWLYKSLASEILARLNL